MNKRITLLPMALLLLLCASVSCTVQPSNFTQEKDNIKDAYWVLLSVEGQDVEVLNDTRTAYIRLEENEKDVDGFTGCNKISGSYTLSGEQLQLSELSTTRMACPDMEAENRLMNALRRVNNYKLSGDLLTLFDGEKAVATFMTGNPDMMQKQVEDQLNIELTD